jgi:hypothetical protein
MDLPLLVIGVLLLSTLAAFFGGATPYPFGWIVLSVLLVARLLQLAGKK